MSEEEEKKKCLEDEAGDGSEEMNGREIHDDNEMPHIKAILLTLATAFNPISAILDDLVKLPSATVLPFAFATIS